MADSSFSLGDLSNVVREGIREGISQALQQSRTSPFSANSGQQANNLHQFQSSQSTTTNSGQAANMPTGSSTDSLGKRRNQFSPPSLFKRARNIKKSSSKVARSYVRDIMCLPMEGRKGSKVAIPRGEYRSNLIAAGLMGKVDISSSMTEFEVRSEICKVFHRVMGLSRNDCAEELFPFEYLQSGGQGCKCLCIPSVSSNFECIGEHVAALAKSGKIIYILASKALPGYDEVSSIQHLHIK